MSCPTCSHTMQNVGAPDTRIFWCPRCGTLKAEDPGLGTDLIDRPFLVYRVRDNIAHGGATFDAVLMRSLWLGMIEAVYPPEERPG